jgi:hypothetical protein
MTPSKPHHGPVMMTQEEEAIFRAQAEHEVAIASRLATARLINQFAGSTSIPQQDPADIAVAVQVHRTITQYGKALVSGDDSVAELNRLEAVAATIPPVDQAKVNAWARTWFAQHQLPAYAALVLAHLGPAAYARRVGHHVLQHILASGIMQAALGPGDVPDVQTLDPSAVWQRLADAAMLFLVNYDQAVPSGPRLARRLHCPRCSRRFALPVHLGRHLNATHHRKRKAK